MRLGSKSLLGAPSKNQAALLRRGRTHFIDWIAECIADQVIKEGLAALDTSDETDQKDRMDTDENDKKPNPLQLRNS